MDTTYLDTIENLYVSTSRNMTMTYKCRSAELIFHPTTSVLTLVARCERNSMYQTKQYSGDPDKNVKELVMDALDHLYGRRRASVLPSIGVDRQLLNDEVEQYVRSTLLDAWHAPLFVKSPRPKTPGPRAGGRR